MKSTVLFSLLVLCVFTSYLPCAQSVVVDTDGDPIINGGRYYIVPVIKGSGGGLELAATGGETCPLTVVQSRHEHSKGLPVVISSPLRILYVSEGLNLYLRFFHVPLCAPTPSNWKIVNGLPEGPAVKLPGYTNTETGWFRIKKASDDNDYKLVFCTSGYNKCRNVGINTDDNGDRRLVLDNNNPLKIHFQKVESSTSEALIMENHVFSPNRELV